MEFRKVIAQLSKTSLAAMFLTYWFTGRATYIIASAVLSVMVLSSNASAQVDRGEIAGTVTDQSGAVVSGADVIVKDLASNAQRSAKSPGTGLYTIVGLEPGTYSVAVTAAQFKPFTANIEITVGGHVTLDARLSVDTSVTQVEVIAAGGAAVNTQTQELSQVIDTQQLAKLPSLTRNPYDFVVLSGNVSNGDSTT